MAVAKKLSTFFKSNVEPNDRLDKAIRARDLSAVKQALEFHGVNPRKPSSSDVDKHRLDTLRREYANETDPQGKQTLFAIYNLLSVAVAPRPGSVPIFEGPKKK